MKTATELIAKNYNRFKNKKDITALNNALYSIEYDYTIRDKDGNKTGGFKDGVFNAITQKMRNEFVSSKRRSLEIKEFCVEIMKEMKY